MSVYDVKWVLAIDIATFLIAVAAVLLIGTPYAAPQKHETQTFFHDMRDSFRYLTAQQGVLWLVVLTSVLCFYIGLLQSLYGPMMLTLANSQTLGVALSASASGMMVSSLFIGVLGMKGNKVFMLSLFLALAGLCYACMGLFTSVKWIIVFGFLFFATLPFANTSLEVLIRRNVDNERQGRAWSLVSAISQIGYILAFASAGFLADRLFNPALLPNGVLGQSVGRMIGTGPGRGIGLMFILSGLFVSILAVIIGRVGKIRALESEPDRSQGAAPVPGLSST